MSFNNTYIQLVQSGNTGTSGYIDLDKDLPVALTYSVADIQDISKKNSSYSKTVYLPGTKNNNSLLGNIFNINLTDCTFDLNRKQSVIVISNGIPVLRGYMQLISVKKLSPTSDLGEEQLSYEVLIFDNKVNFYDVLGAELLEDIDFSQYDHEYNATNIMGSSAHTWEDCYIYPQMYNVSTNFYETIDYQPAIFVKTYVDRIFEQAGYSYTSDFFNSEPFTKLIVPYNGDLAKISDAERNRRLFQASITSSTAYVQTNSPTGYTVNSLSAVTTASTIYKGVRVPFNDDTSTVAGNFDNGPNNYNVVTKRWTVDRNGTFDLSVAFKGTFTYSAATNGYLWKDNSQTSYVGPTPTNSWVYLIRNGTSIIYTYFGPSFGVPQRGVWNNVGPDLSANTQYNIAVNINFTAAGLTLFSGDTIDVHYFIAPPYNKYWSAGTSTVWTGATAYNRSGFGYGLPANHTIIKSTVKFNFDSVTIGASNRLKNTAYVANMVDGETVNLNNYIPRQVKKKDFFAGLVNMFNLYIEQDPEVETNLIIKTRDQYYSANTAFDWSEKIQLDAESNVKFLAELQNKRLNFTYKQDQDLFNKDYFNNTGLIYGQKLIDFDNDYLKGERKIEPLFSPTPLVFNGFSQVVSSIDSRAPKNNIRILYVGGMKDGKFNYRYVQGSGYVTQTRQQYLYAGHFDDFVLPTIDLNFSENQFLYYNTWTSTTNNTLYEAYWGNYVDQIANGKMLTAYFNLNESDIFNLKFSDKVFIIDSFYYINKISDYNFIDDSLTKVELIKVDDGLRNFPRRTRPRFNKGEFESKADVVATALNAGGVVSPMGNNQVKATTPGVVLGNLNTVNYGSEKYVVNGDENFIDNAKSVVILNGSGNTVTDGAERVMLVNTSNQRVTESDVVYINGVKYKNGIALPGYNDIDSGQDVVLNPFYTAAENDIDSAQDAVRGIGGISPIQDFDSAEDATI